ncbi:MAG: hypothetical protein K2X77_04940 [Candidatus Obscuribacterales bacterium]|nr:hypothetical protein [Candidatus Obscuribacterales bacterium]
MNSLLAIYEVLVELWPFLVPHVISEHELAGAKEHDGGRLHKIRAAR